MKIEKIFTLSDTNLKNSLRNELHGYGYCKEKIHNKGKFLYAEGNAPYMLVAHLDTVHKSLPSIICYSKDGDYMMSPQGIGGDDRCGVYIILALLKKLPFQPYVVFTMGEEIGGIGAQAFTTYITNNNKIPELKYIVEFDRKGKKDCVFYECDNQDFTDFVEGFGFTRAYGTFSDISTIAPALGVAAVNLSSGYYNPHTNYEYVSMNDMHDIIEASYNMLCAECNAFEYVEKQYSYPSGYHQSQIDVSFVPEGTVYICTYYSGELRRNKNKELVIDQYGNYYRYSLTYGDIMNLFYAEIVPVDDDNEPIYDPENSMSLPFYGVIND